MYWNEIEKLRDEYSKMNFAPKEMNKDDEYKVTQKALKELMGRDQKQDDFVDFRWSMANRT